MSRRSSVLLRKILPAVALALLAALAADGLLAGPRRYLVIPFENLSSEPSLAWLGEALSERVASRLELMGMRTVTRTERLDALADLALPNGPPLTMATMLRVAERVRAERLVTGSFSYEARNGVKVMGRLLDLEDMKQIWNGTRPGTLAGIFGLMDPLVLEAASRDRDRLASTTPGDLASIADPPLPLYEIIVETRAEPEPERRAALLEKALEQNRQSAHLRRALAEALSEAGRLKEALDHLEKIPAKSAPDAWRLYLHSARLRVASGDIEGAMADLSRSVEAGDNAEAHLLLARLHADRGELFKARAEAKLAAELDPGHPDLVELRAFRKTD